MEVGLGRNSVLKVHTCNLGTLLVVEIDVADVLARRNLGQVHRQKLLAKRTNVQEEYQLFDGVLLCLHQEVVKHLSV